MKLKPKDCLSCGLCCLPTQPQDAFCDVVEKDLKLLKGHLRGRVVRPSFFATIVCGGEVGFEGALKTRMLKQRAGMYKGSSICACTFLAGNVGHKVRCLVYKMRPKVCREAVKPGDGSCRIIRKHHEEVAPRIRNLY